MCGRMNITDNEGVRLLMELVGMPFWPSIRARYNVAPTAQLETLASAPSDSDAKHKRPKSDSTEPQNGIIRLQCQWGMIPVWAKPGQFSTPLINARAETVWEKPSFKNLIKRQRVCVPINGFYEWRREKKQKIPFFIYPAQARAMFVAGIYQKSNQSESGTRYDVTLLTTAANSSMSPVHHRMPVIIDKEAVNDWLFNDDVTRLNQLMQPAAENVLAMHEVGSFVNNARNEGPECIAEVPATR